MEVELEEMVQHAAEDVQAEAVKLVIASKQLLQHSVSESRRSNNNRSNSRMSPTKCSLPVSHARSLSSKLCEAIGTLLVECENPS